ncbi:MAG: TonB-dependent receptor [Deltaproteobacteria bacterium]|nr:TonB-dependent receptor [Deltaproteobacteria bacterium]MCB9788738.1 TonB-dependent receptor [Deltaproteobacteria bacterium]
MVHDPGPGATPAYEVPRHLLTEPGASPASVLRRVPGVWVLDLGGPGAAVRAGIRGAGAEQVRVYLDGVVLDQADGAQVDLSDLPLFDAERLSIWRSHAPLGREGGIGGALELRSRRPRDSEVEAAVEGGAFGTVRAGARGSYAAPEAPFGLALSAEVLRSDGDFGWTDDGGTRFDSSDDLRRRRANADARRLTGLLSARGDAGPCELSLLAHALVQEQGLPGPASAPSVAARYERASQLTAARAACARERWSLEGSVSLRWQRARSDDPYGELSVVPSRARRDALAPALDLGTRLALVPWLDLGVHGELRHERYRLRDTRRQGVDRAQDRTTAALATELPVTVDALALRLVPRLRLERWESTADQGRAALTWQAAAEWTGLAGHGLQVQAAVGTAVRAPSLFELHGDGATILPAADLRAERALTGSASIRYAPAGLPAGWLLDLELSAFASRVSDLIRLRRNTLWSAVAENVPGARLFGVEWSLRADLFSHLRLVWSHASLRSETESEDAASDGKPLPLRPAQADHARLEAYHVFPRGTELRLFGDLDHTGTNTYDAAALIEAPARLTTSVGVGARVAMHGMVGPSASLDLGVTVQNLLDQPAVDLVGYPLPGRSWSLRVAWLERFP